MYSAVCWGAPGTAGWVTQTSRPTASMVAWLPLMVLVGVTVATLKLSVVTCGVQVVGLSWSGEVEGTDDGQGSGTDWPAVTPWSVTETGCPLRVTDPTVTVAACLVTCPPAVTTSITTSSFWITKGPKVAWAIALWAWTVREPS